MSETSTELLDSLIPLATIKAERLGRSLNRVAAAVQLGLSDAELNPELIDEERRAELAGLSNELLAFLHQGSSLLKDIVEVGGLAVEENGGGLPLRIMAPESAPLAIGAGSNPAEEESVAAASPDLDQPIVKSEKAKLPEVSVKIGDIIYSTETLGLEHLHEVSILLLLPLLDGKAITRARILELGFHKDATESARSQAFRRAVDRLAEHLKSATSQEILTQEGKKSSSRYLVKTEIVVNDIKVIPTEEESVKKN